MPEQRDYGNIISPTFEKVTLVPGQLVSGSFTFTNGYLNNAPASQEFVVKIAFVFQRDGVPVVYPQVPSELARYDMAKWVSIDAESFTLSQSASKKITYTIAVPDQPIPGGKYATIVIMPKTEATQLQSGATVNQSIGFSLIGRIAGEENIDSEVVSFSADQSVYFWWPSKPIIFTTTIKNLGNIDSVPGGNIFTYKSDVTKPIWQAPLNPDALTILPENTRQYTTEWNKSQPLFSVSEKGLNINLEYFRVGRVNAIAKIRIDQQGQRITVDRYVSFWILPIPLIVAILTVIIVIFSVVTWRNRIKRK